MQLTSTYGTASMYFPAHAHVSCIYVSVRSVNRRRHLLPMWEGQVWLHVNIRIPLRAEIQRALALRSANTEDGARLDIRARGFWNRSQDAFFDVRVFYPNASSNRSTNISSAYRKHELLKKREYGQRVRDLERGVFTPIVLTTTGGFYMGHETTTFYKRLADMIARKQYKPYSTVMGWLRCRLSFATLRSAIMCVRGSRSALCMYRT